MASTVEDRTRQALTECGALLEGHFVLKSGRHSARYVDKDMAAMNPAARDRIALRMIEKFTGIEGVDTIVGIPMGALALATTVADKLHKPLVFIEKKFLLGMGIYVVRPSAVSSLKDKSVFVVEDVVTRGTTVAAVIERLLQPDVRVSSLSVGCIVNREGWGPATGVSVPLNSLWTPDPGEFQSWPAKDCPLCSKNVPINTEAGHGGKVVAGVAGT